MVINISQKSNSTKALEKKTYLFQIIYKEGSNVVQHQRFLKEIKALAMNSPLDTTTNPAIDILIINRQPVMRFGLAQLLLRESNLNLVGEADSGIKGIELAQALKPDLVLVDLKMPEMDGLETIGALRKNGISPKVIIFSGSRNEEDVVKALESGVDGYLLDDIDPEQLVKSIRAAANGKLAVSPQLTETIAMAIQQRNSSQRPAYENLTQREKQVLKLVTDCLSNKMIARKLNITEGTVKVHVKRLLHKLNMRSRVEAAVWLTEQKAI